MVVHAGDYAAIIQWNAFREQVKSATSNKGWDALYSMHRRHLHVAYALLKGRTMSQIEQKSHDKLNVYLVKKYIKQYTGSDAVADSFDLETGIVNRDLMHMEEVAV